MEGVQIREEWQDDEIYELGDTQDDFYKRSVPKMDSIMEDEKQHTQVESSISTDSLETTSTDDGKQRLRVDSDLKRLRDNSMSSQGDGRNRGREDSEISDATLEKFASQLRRMSEDSLEDDIKYLEEEGELEMSEEDDDDTGEFWQISVSQREIGNQEKRGYHHVSLSTVILQCDPMKMQSLHSEFSIKIMNENKN